jgi:hypothetical protein
MKNKLFNLLIFVNIILFCSVITTDSFNILISMIML